MDLATLPGSGSSSSDVRVKGLLAVGIDHGPPPLGIGLSLGNLTGNIGYDRPISSELAPVVGEFRQSLEVGDDVDGSSARLCSLTCSDDQIQQDVSTELVHCSCLAGASEAASYLIDALHSGSNQVGWEVDSKQVRGAGFGWFGDQPAVVNGILVASPSILWINLHTQLADLCAKLPRGEQTGICDDMVHDITGGSGGYLRTQNTGFFFEGDLAGTVPIVSSGLQIARLDRSLLAPFRAHLGRGPRWTCRHGQRVSWRARSVAA